MDELKDPCAKCILHNRSAEEDGCDGENDICNQKQVYINNTLAEIDDCDGKGCCFYNQDCNICRLHHKKIPAQPPKNKDICKTLCPADIYEKCTLRLAQAINEAAVRTQDILVIKRKRSFDVKPDDDSKVELNEGYEYITNAPIPEIADGVAKMAIEMDNMPELGENGGMMFLTLCAEFYKKLKGGE